MDMDDVKVVYARKISALLDELAAKTDHQEAAAAGAAAAVLHSVRAGISREQFIADLTRLYDTILPN